MKVTIKNFALRIAMLFVITPASAYDFQVDGIYYSIVSLSDLTCKVEKGDKIYGGEIVIPSEVTYNNRKLTVTGIGRAAFRDCDFLHSVTIPNTVTKIDDESFQKCSRLTSIIVPNSVTYIGAWSFSGCKSLKHITLSNALISISNALFNGCKALEALDIPGSVEHIDQFVLYKNDKVNNTFENCKNLVYLRLLSSQNESELKVGYYSLDDGFHSYKWGDWTETIKDLYIDRTLEKPIPVPNLERLELGESVKKVQVDNITRLNNLTTLESHALTPPKLTEMSNSQYINMNVLVPQQALEAYMADPVWGKFWNLQPMGVESIGYDKEKIVTCRYDVSGRPVDENFKGLVIVRFSDGSTKKVLN